MFLIGGIAVVAILFFTYGTKGMDRWSRSRTSLAAAKKRLSEVETDQEKLAGLLALVPVFESPASPGETNVALSREVLRAVEEGRHQ